jgi:Ethanolamine utilization protein EutJ (predicted chaperonin)
MINPATYNIKAYQGATYNLNLTWAIGGTAVNLTSYSAAMQVRENPSATATILSLTNGSGITLGGTAGTIVVNVPANTMGAATPGNYVYDLELNSGGQVTRLIQGGFAIQAEVTK